MSNYHTTRLLQLNQLAVKCVIDNKDIHCGHDTGGLREPVKANAQRPAEKVALLERNQATSFEIPQKNLLSSSVPLEEDSPWMHDLPEQLLADKKRLNTFLKRFCGVDSNEKLLYNPVYKAFLLAIVKMSRNGSPTVTSIKAAYRLNGDAIENANFFFTKKKEEKTIGCLGERINKAKENARDIAKLEGKEPTEASIALWVEMLRGPVRRFQTASAMVIHSAARSHGISIDIYPPFVVSEYQTNDEFKKIEEEYIDGIIQHLKLTGQRIIALSIYSVTAIRCLDFVRKLRDEFGDELVIITGGYYVTSAAFGAEHIPTGKTFDVFDLYKDKKGDKILVDIAVIGAGHDILPRILDGKESLTDIPSIEFVENGKLYVTRPRASRANWSMEFDSEHFFSLYRETPDGSSFIIKYGCPFKCDWCEGTRSENEANLFCTNESKSKEADMDVPAETVQYNLHNLVEYLIHYHDTVRIHIDDPTFTLSSAKTLVATIFGKNKLLELGIELSPSEEIKLNINRDPFLQQMVEERKLSFTVFARLESFPLHTGNHDSVPSEISAPLLSKEGREMAILLSQLREPLIAVGIESLHFIKTKGGQVGKLTVFEYKARIRRIFEILYQEYAIRSRLYLIWGFEGETYEQAQMTSQFALEIIGDKKKTGATGDWHCAHWLELSISDLGLYLTEVKAEWLLRKRWYDEPDQVVAAQFVAGDWRIPTGSNENDVRDSLPLEKHRINSIAIGIMAGWISPEQLKPYMYTYMGQSQMTLVDAVRVIGDFLINVGFPALGATREGWDDFAIDNPEKAKKKWHRYLLFIESAKKEGHGTGKFNS